MLIMMTMIFKMPLLKNEVPEVKMRERKMALKLIQTLPGLIATSLFPETHPKPNLIKDPRGASSTLVQPTHRDSREENWASQRL
jgi:hypothetical protein